jgi:hypothetical protein
MDQENTAARPESWQRLTILDILLLLMGHALAGGVMRCLGMFDSRNLRNLDLLTIAAGLAGFFILGGLFSFPIIYFVQFLLRHRRKRLASGELQAVATIIFWGFMVLKGYSLVDGNFWDWMIVGLFFLFFVIGGIVAFCRLLATHKKPPCPWLSFYGYVFGLLSWVGFLLLAYIANMALSNIHH